MLEFFNFCNLWMLHHGPARSPVDTFLDAEAIVTDSIPLQGKGKIRLFGSYWPAKAGVIAEWEIPVGARVIVQRREGIVLVVAPLSVWRPSTAKPRQAASQIRFKNVA